MTAFFAMGGFAAFVWPCYVLTAIGMGWLGYQSHRRATIAAKQLNQLEQNKS